MKRDIEIILLKLTDGLRIMRLSEPVSGLCLEMRLDKSQPVAKQQKHWKQVFESMLDRELGTINSD